MGEKVLEMRGISVQRGRHTILGGIDFAVERGENWVILGGNGSGKTSLLNVLMGYLVPTTGEVKMPGREEAAKSPWLNWDDWRKRIGYVSSSLAQRIEPDELASEIVLSGRFAMINYWKQDEEADRSLAHEVDAALEKVGCLEKRDHPWCVLSHGERQRVLIARALMVQELELLILDEPCTGLDPVARENFLGFMEGLIQQQAFHSLLLVTHHVEEILPSITHALILKQGRVIAQGAKVETLTSGNLSDAFSGPVDLKFSHQRYHLSYGEGFAPEDGKIV